MDSGTPCRLAVVVETFQSLRSTMRVFGRHITVSKEWRGWLNRRFSFKLMVNIFIDILSYADEY